MRNPVLHPQDHAAEAAVAARIRELVEELNRALESAAALELIVAIDQFDTCSIGQRVVTRRYMVSAIERTTREAF